LLDTEFYAIPPNHIIQNPKCFEAKWLKEPGFCDIVKEKWLAARENVIDVHESLKSMHDGIHDWDSRVLKKPKKAIWKAQFELEELMRGPMSPESDQKKHQIAKLIEKLLEQEEIKWCQHSRANWLQNGDKNTGFFHSFASARKKRNHIKQLKDPTGQFIEGTDLLNPLIQNYFTDLFSSGNQVFDPSFMEKVRPKVSTDMNNMLIAPFTADDVKRAVFSIGDLKAPGPDGLHAIFYKKFWNIYGDEITQEILQHSIQELFQMGGTIPRLF
jgi:hypothetical protein